MDGNGNCGIFVFLQRKCYFSIHLNVHCVRVQYNIMSTAGRCFI